MSGIVGGNLGRGSGLIKAGAIDDNSVTLAKMAGLARGKLIYGDTSGDPAALAAGSANEVLTHDGTDFDWAAAAAGGLTSQQVFTSSDTWTKPAGITLVKVYVTGGGGGGGWSGSAQYSSGGGGGAGGTAIEIIDVSGVSTVAVTVGAAASGGDVNNWPEGGATSSFGAYCSATGGTRGPYSGGLDAAANGGVGSNGQINLTGGAGEGGAANTSFNNTSGAGGNSFWGGAGAGDLSAVGNAGSHGGGGGGGSSSGSNGESGGNGGAGLVVVEEYK